MTAGSPGAPRLVLRLPGTWLQLDRSRPHLTHRRIRAFVDASVGPADELARARADLRKALAAMLESADGSASHESTFLCHQIAPGVTTPIAVSVFAPTEVRMSPVNGTRPEAVIGGFLNAMDAIGGGDGGDGDDWQRLACADGWAARRWRLSSRAVAPGTDAVPSFTADYWRTVPDSKRLMLVTVTSPLAVIPRTMLRLADAIVAGSRLVQDQPSHPRTME